MYGIYLNFSNPCIVTVLWALVVSCSTNSCMSVCHVAFSINICFWYFLNGFEWNKKTFICYVPQSNGLMEWRAQYEGKKIEILPVRIVSFIYTLHSFFAWLSFYNHFFLSWRVEEWRERKNKANKNNNKIKLDTSKQWALQYGFFSTYIQHNVMAYTQWQMK